MVGSRAIPRLYGIPQTLETKLFPDWKSLMIMLCYIHQRNTCPRSTTETGWNMFKIVNKDIRTTSLTSLIDIVNFEQVNVCVKPVSWHYSTPEQNEIITLLSLLLILNIWHLVLVFLLLTFNMYLFLGFDLLIFQPLLVQDESKFHLFIERISSK